MFDPADFTDPQLTTPDVLVLENLLLDIKNSKNNVQSSGPTKTCISVGSSTCQHDEIERLTKDKSSSDAATITALQALNDPKSEAFDPTIFVLWDTDDLPAFVRNALQPYVKWAQSIVRNPLDVVMVTHLLLYFTTSVPSALYLYRNFSWIHGIAHVIMQGYYIGTYTLMRHQHIHMNGILAKRAPVSWFDALFPYITDPLMGHTWNTYYYHHVKHHHVEGNGPDDLSSTLRYQRDELSNLAHYVARFFFVIWLDLPRYFFKKGQTSLAMRAAFWECANFATIATLAAWNFRPTLFVLMIPLFAVRCMLMVGNWGQHAFVDEVEPDSDYRSSITLIDVASNRFCFNDGYHTSHHLNPRRHWRDHPLSVIQQKERYSSERALVFRNIDYIMITVRLMMKDYRYLAKCMVPIGDQIGMTLDEREAMLRTKTKRFSEEDIQRLFPSTASSKDQ